MKRDLVAIKVSYISNTIVSSLVFRLLGGLFLSYSLW